MLRIVCLRGVHGEMGRFATQTVVSGHKLIPTGFPSSHFGDTAHDQISLAKGGQKGFGSELDGLRSFLRKNELVFRTGYLDRVS